ncbi:MAG: YfcE family phosphodiesterase [bacterium]
MKIGILSDIHDHISNLRSALKRLQSAQVLICCGDLCSPFIVDELGKGFTSGDIHVVFGNNDGDPFRITTKAAGYDHLTLHGEFCELKLDSKRLAINHFDAIGRALAKSAAYDVVCFGHNHQVEISRQGSTLVINPGEIMGGLTGKTTFVIYDTVSHKADLLSL